MSACANTQTHTQNFKTKSSTRANSTIFLLVTLTWAQFPLKLMGFFSLSQACRIKPAGSQQTTTEVVRSLVPHDTHTDHCRGQGFFFSFFLFLPCAGSVSYQKIKKKGAFSDSRWQTRPMPQWFLLFKDGNRVTHLLYLIFTFCWKVGDPPEIFSCAFPLEKGNKIETEWKVCRMLATPYMKWAREWGELSPMLQWQKLSLWHADCPYSSCDCTFLIPRFLPFWVQYLKKFLTRFLAFSSFLGILLNDLGEIF